MSNFILHLLFRNIQCPDCGTALPKFMSPLRKTGRMWWKGGFLCSQCGCQTDVRGNKVEAERQLGYIPMSVLTMFCVALLVGFAMCVLAVFIVAPWVEANILAEPPKAAPRN